MPGTDLSSDPISSADVLDHSRDFVELVQREAPGEYRALLASGCFQSELETPGAFNFGKLYAWAEWLVFEREFRSRFPGASQAAAINAFCSLFLKNDISMMHLVEFMQSAQDEGRRLPLSHSSPKAF